MKQETLSPRAAEQQKSAEAKKDDWGYTLAHTFTCLSVDAVKPFFSSAVQKTLTGKANLLSHFVGEIAGDFLAVPATIAVQRFAPEATAALRHMVEPIMRPAYEKSATQAAESWAHQQRISEDSPAFEAYRQQQYEYEMNRVPLQLTWTVMSVVLNVAIQRTFLPNEETVKDIALSTGAGALVTLGLQSLGRVFLPDAMHAVDNAANSYVVAPITKLFGGETVHGEGKVAEARQQVASV